MAVLGGILLVFGIGVLVSGLGVMGLLAFMNSSASESSKTSLKAGAVVAGMGFVSVIVGGGMLVPSTSDPSARTAGVNSDVNESVSLLSLAPDQKEETKSVTVETVVENEVIRYDNIEKTSSAYAKGESLVAQTGVNGENTLTYEVTYVDGVEDSRVLLNEEVTRQPVDQITTVGTYVEPVAAVPQPVSAPAAGNCHSAYTGACVPIDTDVDCAGGSGNGPSYVRGPVYLSGSDPYGLDRDGDGIGCE